MNLQACLQPGGSISQMDKEASGSESGESEPVAVRVQAYQADLGCRTFALVVEC